MNQADQHEGTTTGVEIAIVGMAGRFPGAPDVDAFWRNVRDGVESVTPFSDAELRSRGIGDDLLSDPLYVKSGVVFEGMDRFDAAFFDHTPREARQFDPQHRLFLETAWEALENAGYGNTTTNPLTGIYAGAGTNLYLMRHLLASVDWRQADIAALLGLMNGNDHDSLVSRVAYKLDLRGPAVAVQTACSTSLAAVHLACRGLLNHEADMALAGGVWLNLLQQGGYRHQPGAILSADGHCRAFDARAGGTVIGSGVGIVVLKRLADALADGDTIHAVVKGSALNNDGAAKVGYAAPSVQGQAEVILAALAMAGVPADSIGCVEAHGTGTTLGDPIEVAALTQAFRASTDLSGYCALGSVKTNIGHLDAAAGVAGLIKAVMALRHRTLPPSLHFDQANPQIDFARSPFYVNTAAKPWPQGAAPRRAGVSSFGMGGTNVHVVLEEAPPVPARAIGEAAQLLLLSAKSAPALEAAAGRLAVHLARPSASSPLADAAHTLRTGRQRFAHRAAVWATDAEQAVQALTERSAGAFYRGQVLSERPTLAFLFPGQGAQHVNMGRALYEREPVFRAEVDRCCALLEPQIDGDLRRLLFPPPALEADAATRLQQTAMTQPALFIVEYAMARLWMSWGQRPDAMLGHSVGEYVAACVADVFSLEDALGIVVARGRLVQATQPGAMLAVSLPETELAARGLPAGCDLAGVNAAGLCVLSGPSAAIEQAERELSARGVVARRLHVSHAFHSALVEPALGEFERLLSRVHLAAPSIPFVSNLSGRWITAEEARSPAYWVRHLRGTVRFADGLSVLMEKPDRVLLEVGPGETLCTLARSHPAAGAGRVVLASQCHPTRPEGHAEQPARCLAQLWVAGIAIDGARVFEAGGRRVPLPTYPFDRQVHWIEPAVPAPQATAPSGAKRDVADWFHAPSWRRVEALAPAAPPPGSLLLLGEADGLTETLALDLDRQGRTVVRVHGGDGFARLGQRCFAVRPAERADFEQLLITLEDDGCSVSRVLHLWSLGVDQADALRRGFHSLVALAQALCSAKGERQVSITVVADGVEDVTGAETLVPENATLHGACKVIPLELPNCRCRVIDVLRPSAMDSAWLQRQVLLEIDAADDKSVVAYRGPHRWIKRFEPVRRDGRSPQVLRTGCTIVITGGLGGIGLSLAMHLARVWQARLVLIGRTLLAGDDARWRLVREMEAAGAQVLVLRADVSDAAQLREAIDAAHRRFGPIHGAIHAAGVPGGGVIARRSRAEMEQVFAPKLQGSRHLLAALRGQPLDFVLLCSSLSAITGAFGQADYAAANAYLDALAVQASREGGARVMSVNWDAWREVGMAARQPLPDGLGLTPEQGGEVLERLLCAPHAAQTLVSTISLDQQFAQMRSPALADRLLAEPGVPSVRQARPALQTAYAAPSSELEQALATLCSDFIGIAPIGVDDHFFELGGDSLLAIQWLAQVRAAYGVELHPAAFFKAPTVAALAALVEARLIDEIESAGSSAEPA